MPIYDISLTISNDLPVWPGDTPINLVRNKDMQHGELVHAEPDSPPPFTSARTLMRRCTSCAMGTASTRSISTN